MDLLEHITNFVGHVSALGLFGYAILFLIGYMFIQKLNEKSELNAEFLKRLDKLSLEYIELHERIVKLEHLVEQVAHNTKRTKK